MNEWMGGFKKINFANVERKNANINTLFIINVVLTCDLFRGLWRRRRRFHRPCLLSSSSRASTYPSQGRNLEKQVRTVLLCKAKMCLIIGQCDILSSKQRLTFQVNSYLLDKMSHCPTFEPHNKNNTKNKTARTVLQNHKDLSENITFINVILKIHIINEIN